MPLVEYYYHQKNKTQKVKNLILHKEENLNIKGKDEQKSQGLKIMTLKQKTTTRLPILLAGNNSQKLKNEIRQIAHSLYRYKKLEQNCL